MPNLRPKRSEEPKRPEDEKHVDESKGKKEILKGEKSRDADDIKNVNERQKGEFIGEEPEPPEQQTT